MWTPSDAKKLFRALAVLALLGLPVLDGAVPAQTSPSATSTSPESRQELRQLLERRYEVLPIRNGVLLRPRQERLGVRTIELSGDSVAINGERVSNGVLRAWLGEDADPILRLQAMEPAERAALFNMDQAGGAEPVPAGEDEEAGEIPEPAMDTAAGIPPVPEPPAAPPPPVVAEAGEDGEDGEEPATRLGSQVNVGGPITVSRGEIAEEAVAVLGPVRVDGEVVQDAVAVLGAVRINGRVGGEVVAVMGSVTLGPDAEVMGDVTSVGGNVRRAPGSR
ncbi:MAG TPA: hypothetical protein VEL74_05605, partial [Thermoanaerobaculia bacterium]|nr:hypothetical protein [Thermoanaerobaculia bacterium]